MDSTKPTPQDTVLSCGHGGPATAPGRLYEKLDVPITPPLRLGKPAPKAATWRVTCAACVASGGISPRMVWIGPFSDVDKGFMGPRGALL